MSSAQVYIAEIDRSSRIPESNGVYGFMALPLVKGTTEEVGFSTTEEQFLTATTPEGRIEPGMDLGYYVALDFLRRSNKLYWARAHNGSKFSGLILPANGTSAAPKQLSTGESSPEDYIFSSGEALLIYPSSSGDWGNNLSVQVTKNSTLSNAVNLLVYWKGVLKETWAISRIQSAKDGYGQSLYVENVLKGSDYIRAIDNLAIDENILPKLITVTTATWNDAQIESAYQAAADVVPKEHQYSIVGNSLYSGSHPVVIAGIPVAVTANADADQTAEDLAAASTALNTDVFSTLSTGNVVDVAWRASAGDVSDPASFMDKTPATTSGGAPGAITLGVAATAQVRFTALGYERPRLTITTLGRTISIYPSESSTFTEDAWVSAIIAHINNDVSLPYRAEVGATTNILRIVNKTPGTGYSLPVDFSGTLVNMPITDADITWSSSGTYATAELTYSATGEFNPAHVEVTLGANTHTVEVWHNDTPESLIQKVIDAEDALGSSDFIVSTSSYDVLDIAARLEGTAGNSLTVSVNTTIATADGGNGGVGLNIIKSMGGGIDRVTFTDATASNTVVIVESGNAKYTTEPRIGEAGPKVFQFLCGDNDTGTSQMIIIEGVEITIPEGAVSTAVATAIAAQSAAITAANTNLASVTASTSHVVFTYQTGASYAETREPRISATAALLADVPYTSQSYIAPVAGRPQIEDLNVTASPTVDGNISVNGNSISIKATDTESTVASKIAAALNALPAYSAIATGPTVTITRTSNGQTSTLSLSPGSTGATMSSTLIQTGQADVDAIPKKSRIKILEGNVYKASININISDVNCPVWGGDSTALAVASRIATAEGWKWHPDVESISASGNEVEITWKTSTADTKEPEIWSGLTAYSTSSPVVKTEYEAAKVVMAEIQSVQFLTGNTSGSDEIIFINGEPVTLSSSDTTPQNVASRVVSSLDVSSIIDVESVEVSPTDPRTVLINYTTAAGDVANTQVTTASTTPISLSGGTDGGLVTDTHMIRALDLGDKVDFNISMDGGWASVPFQKELATKAENRLNHIAFLTVPYSAEHSSNYINDIIDYRVNQLNLNTTYAALWTGQLKIQDKFNGRQLWISPVGAVGAVTSTVMTEREPWYPIPRYGNLSWPIDVKRHFTQGEMDRLQDAQVNPIQFAPGKGIRLWGQRTLTSVSSARDRINVRLLMIYIEMATKDFLENSIIWRSNDDDTRARVVAESDKFMSSIQARNGVYAFKNVCDTTNNLQQDIDNYRLNFHQLVEPVKGVEFIHYYPTLVPTGTL